jgi:hypothetical protein
MTDGITEELATRFRSGRRRSSIRAMSGLAIRSLSAGERIAEILRHVRAPWALP